MTDILVKGGNSDTGTDRHTRRMLHANESRGQDDAFISQGMAKISSKPPDARGEASKSFSLSPPKEPTLLTPWP